MNSSVDFQRKLQLQWLQIRIGKCIYIISINIIKPNLRFNGVFLIYKCQLRLHHKIGNFTKSLSFYNFFYILNKLLISMVWVETQKLQVLMMASNGPFLLTSSIACHITFFDSSIEFISNKLKNLFQLLWVEAMKQNYNGNN